MHGKNKPDGDAASLMGNVVTAAKVTRDEGEGDGQEMSVTMEREMKEDPSGGQKEALSGDASVFAFLLMCTSMSMCTFVCVVLLSMLVFVYMYQDEENEQKKKQEKEKGK